MFEVCFNSHQSIDNHQFKDFDSVFSARDQALENHWQGGEMSRRSLPVEYKCLEIFTKLTRKKCLRIPKKRRYFFIKYFL